MHDIGYISPIEYPPPYPRPPPSRRSPSRRSPPALFLQGDDAINFFAQYGANSPIKFVHLVRANNGHDFPPYDLVVVTPRECGGDYYLMSSGTRTRFVV